MKYWLFVPLALALCSCFAWGSLLTNPGYNGPLNPETGAPSPEATDEGEIPYAEQVLVALSDTMYYDRLTHDYSFPVAGGELHANIPDGGVSTTPVYVRGVDVEFALYRDGEEQENIQYDDIREEGDYAVTLRGGSIESRVFAFTIVNTQTNRLTGYYAPSSFRFTDAYLNGQAVDFSRDYVNMETDGEYELDYLSDRANVSCTLRVTVDHTPPHAVLEGLREDGRARGPVTITALEEGDTVSCTLDDAPFRVTSATFTRSGDYVLTVYDRVGNTQMLPFTVLIYLDANSLFFFGLILACAAGVVLYVVIKKRRLRIR